MEISPFDLLRLTITSLIFGVCLGVFNDLNRLIRALLGVKYSERDLDELYKRKLPIIHRPLGIYRQSRIKKYVTSIVIFLGDIALFFTFGWGVAIINYYFNDGQVRFYSPISAILGFVVYYFTIGRLSIRLFEVAAFLIKAFILIITIAIFAPIKKIVRFYTKNVKKLYYIIYKILAKKEKKRYNIIKCKKVTEGSKNGFVNIFKEEQNDDKKVL